MIQLFCTNENEKVTNLDFSTMKNRDMINNKWIRLVNPTDKEIESVAKLTGVDEGAIKAPLDDEERSRIEIEDNYSLILFDIPIIEEEEEGYYSYSTLPLAFILTDKFVITVCLKDTAVMRDFTLGRVKTFSTNKRSRFLFQALYNTSTKFLQYLKQIDKASGRIQTELHKSTRNKELFQLLDLENSLVYFSTSLKGNDVVINRLIKTSAIIKYEEDQELIEDVAVENQQAIEMSGIYREILSVTMEGYANIINNNQNNIMKILTSITLLLSIPTLISGIWGMNTWVPGEGKWYGFLAVTVVTVIICIVVGILLHKKKLL